MEKQKKKSGRKKISGGTLFDYARWRGDLSFASSPWNEIDSVIVALISYANLGENELTFQSGEKLRLGSLASSDLLERLPQDGCPPLHRPPRIHVTEPQPSPKTP